MKKTKDQSYSKLNLESEDLTKAYDIKCPSCNEEHAVYIGLDAKTKQGSKDMGFYVCGEETKFVAVNNGEA